MLKPQNFLAFLSLILASCSSNTPKHDQTNINKDSIATENSWDTIYLDSTSRVIGNSTAKGKIRTVNIQFRPFISFEDYPSNVKFKEKLAQIDYKSHKIAREYKTVITEQYKSEGVNFAGYYCLATWGCGAPCAGCAIVDSRTGKVYPGPTSSIGYSFRMNSRMLIVNPPDEDGYVGGDAEYEFYPSIYIWNEEHKVWVKKNSGFEGNTWEKVDMNADWF